MFRSDLILAVSQKTGRNPKYCEEIVNATLEVMMDSLSKGESVSLVGFGTFSLSDKNVVKFRPGNKLKEAVAK